MNISILGKMGLGAGLACFLCFAQVGLGDAIVIAVDDANLPVGGTTLIEVLLDPASGPVSAMGATVTYDPNAIAVQFAGVGPTALGGPAEAIHLKSRTLGRVVFGGALPQGAGHTPSSPESLLTLHVRRLVGDSTEVRLEDPFYLPEGGSVFLPVTASSIVFGIVAADSDSDDIPDAWEYAHFQGLSVADDTSDFDGDGVLDVEEYLAGTPPRVPYLTFIPALAEAHRTGLYRVSLTLPTELGVTYRIEMSGSLANPDWDDATFALSPGGPAVYQEFTGTGASQTFEIPLWGIGPHFLRIVVPSL